MTTMATETNQPTPDAAASPKSTKMAPALGVLLAGVLVLSACGDSPDGGGQAGSEEPSESALSSASPSESAPDGAEEDSDSEAASSSEPTEVAGEDDSDGDADDPVAASSEGPAQNWPEPPLPDEAREQSKAGAEAALAHWFEMMEYARLTMEPEAVAKYSTDDCVGCAKLAEGIIRADEDGVWYSGMGFEVHDAGLAHKSDRKYTGSFLLDSSAFNSHRADGTHRAFDAIRDEEWSVELLYDEENWHVAAIGTIGNDTEGSEDP